MTIPNVTQTIKDGGTGKTPAGAGQIQAKFGVSSLGVANQIYAFSRKEDLIAALGTGPLVESGAVALDVCGGPIYFVPITHSVAGTSGTVTPTRVASSTGTVSTSVAPLDAYAVVVTIVSLGTGQLVTGAGVQITYSLDGGNTVSSPVAIPAGGSYVIQGTGLTLALSLSTTTFDAGDVFTFACKAPSFSTSDLTAAWNAFFADATKNIGFVHVVGQAEGVDDAAAATASAAVAAVCESLATAADTNHRYVRVIMEAPDTTLDSTLITAFASFAGDRVTVCAGSTSRVSAVDGRISRRSSGTEVAIRAGIAPIGEDLARYNSGPLPGVVSLYRDENITPGLDDARFTTLRTFTGQAGFYITNCRLMSAAGSDFEFFQDGRVIDAACTITYAKLLRFLNDGVRVNKATAPTPPGPGTIDERDARYIEQWVNSGLRSGLSGQITDAFITVNRGDNLISSPNLRTTTSVEMLGYAKTITNTVGLENPAIAAAAR